MRLLTRSDFDGLICAVLLKEIGLMDQWQFVHPKDVQDGLVAVTADDILANVPYAPGCGMWFDHHSSEQERLQFNFAFTGASKPAPSCARVIWEYFGGSKKFPARFDSMMDAVDKCDSANFTMEDITAPTGWVLLNFVMDPRTGLGRYRDYRISNYQLMMDLVEYIRTMDIHLILQQQDVAQRIKRYFEQDKLFREMLENNITTHQNVIVLDLRRQEEIYTGNRFTLYTMHPQCNISIQVIWGLKGQNTVFTVGHSIINRTSKTDVGSLMLQFGGGGHKAVGTCQVPTEQADDALRQLIDRMTSDG